MDFEFVDSAAKPLAGIPFKLKDPDGKDIVGVSSMDGKASYGGYAKAESYTVSVCALTQAKWEKTEIAAGEAYGWSVKAEGLPEGTPAWVTVYGTGEGGKPRKHTPYSITLRDGSILKGKLDGNGRAKHEKVTRGRIFVAFGESPQA